MTFDVTSGPHPHSQSQSAEVREVQFEVQRACPDHQPESVNRKPTSALPFAVWVYWPPKRRSQLAPLGLSRVCRTAEAFVHLTPEGQQEWMNRVPNAKWVEFPVLCEHMGRIIE